MATTCHQQVAYQPNEEALHPRQDKAAQGDTAKAHARRECNPASSSTTNDAELHAAGGGDSRAEHRPANDRRRAERSAATPPYFWRSLAMPTAFITTFS